MVIFEFVSSPLIIYFDDIILNKRILIQPGEAK
jgi:hypothetical protein